MGTKENKAVVQRFWDELILGGNVNVADELLAPNYVNLIVEGIGSAGTGEPDDNGTNNIEALKATIADYHASVSDPRMEVLAMAADGDAVFARRRLVATGPDGTTTTSRGLGYYRVVDGKIVMNDSLSVQA